MMKKASHLLQRHNLADAVVGKLQEQLSLGEYQPGDKLPSEPELMTQFGVGRSTIREAIRILANTGLVSVRQGSGTFVELQQGISEPFAQRLKRADTADLNEVRQLLEVKIAEKAALHRTQKDLDKMRELLKKRAIAGNTGAVEDAIHYDIQFHVAVAVASRNSILADLYKTIAEEMTRSFRMNLSNTETFVHTQTWHESLLQGIEEQDPKKAWEWAAKIISH